MCSLAVLIGVDESAISRWRHGQPISMANLIKLCDALEISVDWLLRGRGTMTAQANRASTESRFLSLISDLQPDERARLADVFHVMAEAFER